MILLLCWFVFEFFFISLFAMEVALPVTAKSDIYEMPGFKVTWSFTQVQGTRVYQEDHAAVSSIHEISQNLHHKIGFGLFDGHSGEEVIPDQGPHATVAAQLAGKETGLLPFIFESKKLSMKDIEQKFVDFDNQRFEQSKDGSTAVTCLIDGDLKKIYIAYCGDSQALFINRKSKETIYESVDHDPVSELDRIQNAGGTVEADNRIHVGGDTIAVSRSFGDRSFQVGGQRLVIPDPNVFETDLTDDSVLFVAYTDGFSDYFSQEYPTKDFRNQLKYIIFKLISAGRPIETLSADFLKLINGCVPLAKIIEDLDSTIAHLNDPSFQGAVSEPGDNVSLFVVAIEKNETAEPDPSSQPELTDKFIFDIDFEEIPFVPGYVEPKNKKADLTKAENNLTQLNNVDENVPPEERKSFSAMIGQLRQRLLSFLPSSWTYRLGLVGGLLVVAYLVKWFAPTRVA